MKPYAELTVEQKARRNELARAGWQRRGGRTLTVEQRAVKVARERERRAWRRVYVLYRLLLQQRGIAA